MEMHYDNPDMDSGMLDFHDLLFVRLSDWKASKLYAGYGVPSSFNVYIH